MKDLRLNKNQRLRKYGGETSKLLVEGSLEGKIHLREPSHTLSEYLNPDFLKNFEIENFEEGYDFPASEQVNGDTYPTFFIVKAKKKQKDS